MRRIRVVLAALSMAVMMVAFAAVPAMAQGNAGSHGGGGHMATAHNAGGHDDADFGRVDGGDFVALPALGFSDPLVSDREDIDAFLPVDSI
jgi:hypothetical protein